MENIGSWLQTNFPELLVLAFTIYGAWLLLRQYTNLRRDIESVVETQVKAQLQGMAGGLMMATEQAKRSSEDLKKLVGQAEQQNQEALKDLTEMIREATGKQKELENRVKGILESIPEDLSWLSPRALNLRARQSDTWSEAAPLLRAVLSDPNSTAEDLEVAGDTARKQEARQLALQFYRKATQIDPEKVSPRVEFYALTAEWKYNEREQALRSLEELVVEGLCTSESLPRLQRFF